MIAMPCPACEADLKLPDVVELSEVIECGDCRSEWEVIAVKPVMLALAPEVEEDWGE